MQSGDQKVKTIGKIQRNDLQVKYKRGILCQSNSSETAQQNFVNMVHTCSFEGYTVQMGIIIFTGISGSIVFLQFMFLLNLDICMAKIKYTCTGTSETVCQGNSFETCELSLVVIQDIPFRFACLP